MGILRMVKLFGWEHEVQARIGAVRDGELRFLKKTKILELLTANFK